MPMLLEMFAPTAGKPKASSVGKVISEPEPTMALMAPAPTPARKIATISHTDTGADYLRRAGVTGSRGPTGRPTPGRDLCPPAAGRARHGGCAAGGAGWARGPRRW